MPHSTIDPSVDAFFLRDTQGRYQPATDDQLLGAARKLALRKLQRGAPFNRPDQVRAFLRERLAGLEHEVFAVLFLDTQLQLIEYQEMFRGTLSSAAVPPREVVKEALKLNAGAIIMAHNHPSGTAEPSSSDCNLTTQIKAALGLIDVRVLDHIVVAGDRTTSFAERGLL